MTALFDAWKTYERDVVPTEASTIQREECRRAFYAGAMACLSAVYAATDRDHNGSAERELKALDDEVAAIVTDLRL